MLPLRILVLGASGLLGSTLCRYLLLKPDIEVYAAMRNPSCIKVLPEATARHIIPNLDVENTDRLIELFNVIRPNVVVNSIGIVKQSPDIKNSLRSITINSLLPHRLAVLSQAVGARFIHFSTDCVFSGSKGMYKESDFPDATDLYGRSKLMGEVDYPNSITLRTSLIGHEPSGNQSLVSWFLSQSGGIKGFRRAIFSGLPTVEIARVVHELVLPNPHLSGLYHLSVDPISKFNLLKLVADVYGKSTKIIPDNDLVIDRSLDSSRFRTVTGFSPKPWPELVREMHAFG